VREREGEQDGQARLHSLLVAAQEALARSPALTRLLLLLLVLVLVLVLLEAAHGRRVALALHQPPGGVDHMVLAGLHKVPRPVLSARTKGGKREAGSREEGSMVWWRGRVTGRGPG
jgi:hypothetical protein